MKILIACCILASVATYSYFSYHNEVLTDDGIDNVKVEFTQDSVVVFVRLTRPMNCQDVQRQLGIGELSLKNKMYVPECHKTSEKNIKIVYKPKTII